MKKFKVSKLICYKSVKPVYALCGYGNGEMNTNSSCSYNLQI